MLYCHLWSDWLYHIFPHRLLNDKIFEKIVIEYKMFLLTFSIAVSETFLILIRIRQDIVINLHRYKCEIPAILVRF
jgi:hypothetical protein